MFSTDHFTKFLIRVCKGGQYLPQLVTKKKNTHEAYTCKARGLVKNIYPSQTKYEPSTWLKHVTCLWARGNSTNYLRAQYVRLLTRSHCWLGFFSFAFVVLSRFPIICRKSGDFYLSSYRLFGIDNYKRFFCRKI